MLPPAGPSLSLRPDFLDWVPRACAAQDAVSVASRRAATAAVGVRRLGAAAVQEEAAPLYPDAVLTAPETQQAKVCTRVPPLINCRWCCFWYRARDDKVVGSEIGRRLLWFFACWTTRSASSIFACFCRRTSVVRFISSFVFGCCCILYPQLGNGVRVATEAGGGPVAALTVSVDLGSRYESQESNGVCSVIGASAFTVSAAT